MQTNFTEEQLRNPAIAEADSILRRCVHCGLCTATCPTYQVLGDERDSPRGRIYAIKDMLERNEVPGPDVTVHIDRCLTCLSCMTTCPSGVDYMHLIDIGRSHIEKASKRPSKELALRRMLAAIVPYPARFRWALRVAPIGRYFQKLLSAFGLPELAAMSRMAPTGARPRAQYGGPGTAVTKNERRGRVILLAGCAQQVLRPSINDATIRLLARSGYDVTVSAHAGCCGALPQHIGLEEKARAMARRNIDAWSHEMEHGDVSAIIINTSGCGTTVKDYGHMLARDEKYRERAEKISSLTMDISEFLSAADIGPARRWTNIKVAYHAACSLQHGQRVHFEPKQLLKNAGYSVVDIADSHICCGSAGVYNVLQPQIADELRKRKVTNIRAVRPDLVAAGNIGCIQHIAAGLDLPVVHTVELLDWAHGGPIPDGLHALAGYSTEIPRPTRDYADYIAGE